MTTVNLPRFFRSVRHATHGLVHAFRTENNFRIHVIVGFIVLIAAWLWHIPATQVIVIILVIMAMLILELVNTIVERFADLLEPRIHPYVHVIKDLMASAVIVAAIGAIMIGVIIFWPYIAVWWS
jgi:diacylglycerol kinase